MIEKRKNKRIKDEKLVFEEYFPGYRFDYFGDQFRGEYIEFDVNTIHNLASVTKAFTAALVGIAIDRGFIQDVEEKVFTFFPEYSYLNEERLDRIVVNDFYQVDTWPELISRIAEKTKRLYSKMKASHIGVILHSWLTNEELFLIDKLFRKDLCTNKIGFLDPAEEEADSNLLTSERTPNRRGAKEVGFDINPPNWGKFFEGIELLFVFGSPFMDRSDIAPLETLLERIKTKILLASHLHKLNSQFNVIAPMSLIAEKEGSLTNVDGIIQAFFPSLDSPGDSQPEWQFLVDLARQLRINFKFYTSLSSLDNIREEMKKEIPFFEKNSE